ncbi:MAG: hypothetical protein JXL97_02300 [Bacteroidales bacterium]|nr:hypothetical protein [Bacteroidales bacterium]
MKKIFFSTAFFLLTIIAFSQTEITEIAFPGFGSILYQKTDTIIPKGVDIEKTGEQIWNFKKIKGLSSRTLYVLRPEQTFFHDKYARANYATRIDNDKNETQIHYSFISNDSCFFIGNSNTDPILHFSLTRPHVLYFKKHNYSQPDTSITDELRTISAEGLYLINKLHVTIYNSIDAWGTLKLPKTTAQSIRFKEEYFVIDSSFQWTNEGLSYISDTTYSFKRYIWYEPTVEHGYVNLMTIEIHNKNIRITYLFKHKLNGIFKPE